MLRSLLVLLAVLIAVPAMAQGPLDVTFRFLPDLEQPPIEPVVRAFLPGSFNDWGPNTNGVIQTGAPSQMTFVAEQNEYRYTRALQIGQTYTYKVHYHQNQSGTNWVWISDPLNPVVTGPNNDSVIEVTDPMAFQPALEQNASGQIYAVSASFFGTAAFTSLTYEVNDGAPQDGLAAFDPATGLFRVELPAPIPAPARLRVSATDAQGRTVSIEAGLTPPTVIDAPRPAGLQDGITYVNDTTVRLSLFAPYKSFVHLIGDFNGWSVSDDFLLFRDRQDDDNVWWWIELNGLTPGEEVGFQYLVDGNLRIADLYSEKVLDASNDPFIPSTTYPNLKPYPTGLTTGPVTVIQPGRTPYPWQTTDYERPAMEDLVIYELLVRDFIGARNYQTLRDTLDYLERLGVNAIELMPIQQFGGNLNWGYQPTFHLAVDKFYGPADELRAFIDAAHGRGMAVILDVVYNHADTPSPLVDLYGCVESGLYTNNPPRHPFNVFCDLDHTQPATQRWLDRANRYWIEEFRVDGYRFDLSKGFMQTGPWDGYNPQRIGLLTRMADVIWDADPNFYVILEHLNPNRQEETELALYGRNQGFPGMMMWNDMNRAYSQSAMGYLSDSQFQSNLSLTYPPNKQLPVTGAVTYMESHDEQWMMYRNRAFGPQVEGYDVRSLPIALQRQKLAGTFFFTIPGPRMMWQFGELGYGWGLNGEECLKPGDGSNGECPAAAPGRTAVKPLPWTAPRQYHLDPERRRLFETWSALIHLRRSDPVFTSPQTQVQLRVGQGVAGRRIGLTLDDTRVVIIGNFGLTPMEVNPDFPIAGTWYEFFTREERAVEDLTAPILLGPGEARIYSTVEFFAPPPDIYVSTEPGDASERAAFALSTPYPNPTTGGATIPFALGAATAARVEVYDLLGRRVAVLLDETLPEGAHTVRLDGGALAAGTYLVRLSAGTETATTRLTVLR